MQEQDPTRIDITTDPTKQRMTGLALHGDTPFDVPYISQIKDNLWQGGCENGLVLPDFIQHVVSLYPWEAYTIKHKPRSVLFWWLYDSTGQDLSSIDQIASWVVECIADAPTLVHCQAGLNRSSLVAARALMLSEGMSGQEAVDLIRAQRSPACLCNPAFEKWLIG